MRLTRSPVLWAGAAVLGTALACAASRPGQVPPGAAATLSDRDPTSTKAGDRSTVSKLLSHELALQPEGAVCFAGRECQSGMCEGAGCSKETPGVCVTTERPCSEQRETYCGCDGQSFIASATCPGERFSRRGSCESEPSAPDAVKPQPEPTSDPE